MHTDALEDDFVEHIYFEWNGWVVQVQVHGGVSDESSEIAGWVVVDEKKVPRLWQDAISVHSSEAKKASIARLI